MLSPHLYITEFLNKFTYFNKKGLKTFDRITGWDNDLDRKDDYERLILFFCSCI